MLEAHSVGDSLILHEPLSNNLASLRRGVKLFFIETCNSYKRMNSKEDE